MGQNADKIMGYTLLPFEPPNAMIGQRNAFCHVTKVADSTRLCINLVKHILAWLQIKAEIGSIVKDQLAVGAF